MFRSMLQDDVDLLTAMYDLGGGHENDDFVISILDDSDYYIFTYNPQYEDSPHIILRLNRVSALIHLDFFDIVQLDTYNQTVLSNKVDELLINYNNGINIDEGTIEIMPSFLIADILALIDNYYTNKIIKKTTQKKINNEGFGDLLTKTVIPNEDKRIPIRRIGIYSHHIYSQKKKDWLKKSLRNYDLNAVTIVCGKPGFIMVEGVNDERLQEFWRDCMNLNWQKLQWRISITTYKSKLRTGFHMYEGVTKMFMDMIHGTKLTQFFEYTLNGPEKTEFGRFERDFTAYEDNIDDEDDEIGLL